MVTVELCYCYIDKSAINTLHIQHVLPCLITERIVWHHNIVCALLSIYKAFVSGVFISILKPLHLWLRM